MTDTELLSFFEGKIRAGLSAKYNHLKPAVERRLEDDARKAKEELLKRLQK